MHQLRNRRLHGLALGGVLGLLVQTSAWAQSAETLSVQTDDAFRGVLQQPQDLALWSKYIDLLAKAGNFEGGIAALDRLLLEPGAHPSLNLQVGVFYFRLGSFAMAEANIRKALSDSRLQGAERAVANELLEACVQRNQRNQLSGSFSIGLRHQSNPMYRTDATQVLSGGQLGPLAADQRPNADDDVVLGVRLRHLYDLEQQNSAAIVSTFGAYLIDYQSASGSQLSATPTKPYDLQVFDMSTGLQFKPAPVGLPSLTLRPHVLFANLVSQNQQSLQNQGVGLDANWQLGDRTSADMTLDVQRRDFARRVDVSNADWLNGRLWGLRAKVSHELAPGQLLNAEYTMRRNDAERDFYSFRSHELRLTYAVAYASPLNDGKSWTTILTAGALNRTYNAPDPSVMAGETRNENEVRIGVTQVIPVAPRWSLLFSAEQARNQANLPNFRYENTTLSGTVAYSF